jgi:hypothetical protein
MARWKRWRVTPRIASLVHVTIHRSGADLLACEVGEWLAGPTSMRRPQGLKPAAAPSPVVPPGTTPTTAQAEPVSDEVDGIALPYS